MTNSPAIRHRLTASSLWRAELCPASAVLPESPRRKYADAEHGKAEHARLEESAPPGSFPEIAFAYNVLDGRARRLEAKSRAYGDLDEGEIPGTLDLLTVPEGADHVLVDDYKTGVGYMQAAPPVNPQLQHNAISAARYHGRPRAIVQLIYTRTGEVKDAEFDLFDFAAIRKRLLNIWEGVTYAKQLLAEQGVGELEALNLIRAGDACWRCPCRTNCPIMGKQRKAS